MSFERQMMENTKRKLLIMEETVEAQAQVIERLRKAIENHHITWAQPVNSEASFCLAECSYLCKVLEETAPRAEEE